jgi:heat-inducible transcriptional repressor
MKLIEMPEYADVDRLRKLVAALQEREEIVGLLDQTLAAGAVTVFVGRETGELGDGQLSLVLAPYSENGQPAGTVGVLGPTRMDYARVMPLVDATAAALTDAANAARGGR